jgi:arylsulfatase A-like enzyme
MSSSGYDLSRAVRSDRYKFIYNCTPWIPYGPVDSAGGPLWTEMKAASASGSLPAMFRATYFSSPRPVYELYDLQNDPWELNNLSGKPDLAAVEHQLRLAMAEKMILDYDYLPLPALDAPAGEEPRAKGGKAGKGKKKAG